MNQLPPELAEEAPLDPAAERLRRKMVRLMAVSIGVMFIGIFAVLSVVVFRLSGAGTPNLQSGTLPVPAGFAVTESAVSQDRIALRGTDAEGAMRLLVYDMTGALIGDFAITEGAPIAE